VAPRLAEVAQLLAAGGAARQAWVEAPVQPARAQLRWYAASAIVALDDTRDGELARHPAREVLARSAATWIDAVAFRDLDPSESALARYAIVGAYYQAVPLAADLDARLEAAPEPAPGADHARRGAGVEQLARDLPWIAASPAYWWAELAEQFADAQAPVAPARVVELAARVERACARAQQLGLDHPDFERLRRNAGLLRALFERRPEPLHALLREVRAAGDRGERTEIASWIASAARALPLDWYGEVLEIWRQELNYKPLYFWIAWEAALAGAPEHALRTAELAAAEFPDDPAFLEEYRFMEQRFARPRGPALTPRGSGAQTGSRWPVPTPT
jgi:hypothetical protein